MGVTDSCKRAAGAHRRHAGAVDLTAPISAYLPASGFLALFGVSVQTGVIMLEYINQLRVRGHSIEESAIEGAVLRLRPIMMTMLVATLGIVAGGLVACYRLRLAAPIRHCDCRRPDLRFGDEHLFIAHALRLALQRRRQTSRSRDGLRGKQVAAHSLRTFSRFSLCFHL